MKIRSLFEVQEPPGGHPLRSNHAAASAHIRLRRANTDLARE
jgi:hypothetical protein